jgi:hypothetical protein
MDEARPTAPLLVRFRCNDEKTADCRSSWVQSSTGELQEPARALRTVGRERLRDRPRRRPASLPAVASDEDSSPTESRLEPITARARWPRPSPPLSSPGRRPARPRTTERPTTTIIINLTARSVVCAETSCGCRAAQSVAEADPRPIKPAISARDPPITYARTTSSFLPA